MPEEIDDFEEVKNPVKQTINKNKEPSQNGSIADFKRKKPDLKDNNTPTKNISSMPKKALDTPPKTNDIQNPTPKTEKSNVLPFDRNKKKFNDKLKPKSNDIPNAAKKDNVLPFGKNKNKDNKKNNEKNNPLKDKLGKKKNPVPFGRRRATGDNNKDPNEKDGITGDGNADNKGNDNNSNNKLGQKKGLGNKLNKLRNPGQAIKGGVKNAAQAAIKKILRPIKIKLMTSAAALVGGLAVCFFVIYLILSPLMDIWPYIDGIVRAGANFTEKFLNFFRGFGFEDSKEAFYEEAEELNKFYDESLDMPLLLSTLY